MYKNIAKTFSKGFAYFIIKLSNQNQWNFDVQCWLAVNPRETRMPPAFNKRLESCQLEAGSRLVLNVQATGQPSPGLTWQKVYS